MIQESHVKRRGGDARTHRSICRKFCRSPCTRYKAHGSTFARHMFRLRGAVLAVDDGLKPRALFRGIFHLLLDVAQLPLNLAEVLLNVAFCFQRLVAALPNPKWTRLSLDEP